MRRGVTARNIKELMFAQKDVQNADKLPCHFRNSTFLELGIFLTKAS